MTDECDRQMVLLVVSLITQTQLGVKAELCLVMATNRRQIYPQFFPAPFLAAGVFWLSVRKRERVLASKYMFKKAEIQKDQHPCEF